jgi:hypothetical protein
MIPTAFLFFSLFFPRFTIFFTWLFGTLPAWPGAPWFLKFLMAGLVPRILVLCYIGIIMGLCPWFWVHVIALFIASLITFARLVNKID